MKIGTYEISGNAAIMGILNTTPDSFSDGGQYITVEAAVAQAKQMVADGASIIDIGGESTRPGATFVSAEEEIARVVPVIQAIRREVDCLISIDTYKAETAKAALEAGAHILNDVWAGLYDGNDAMFKVAATYQAPIILMHNQADEQYQDVTKDVCRFLQERAEAALAAGIAKENIWLDPGFGFAKNVEQNLALLKDLEEVTQLGYPVLFGISRKRVVDALLGGNTKPLERDGATAALSSWAIAKGCQIVRVHHVAANKEIVATLSQLV